MPTTQHQPDDSPPELPDDLNIDTVENHLRVYAHWLRAKVRWAAKVDRAHVSLPAATAERIAGLLDYAADAESKH